MANSDSEFRALVDSLRRDERHSDRRGAVRLAAYKRVLDLAHSQDNARKRLATEKIKDYFADFPDLQDQAINAIYDLCEDQDPLIRIAGYQAITTVSRADKNWLVRNADVLVQLLQSDDGEEVNVVKRAIVDHISMDPDRTLQVLCDQCSNDADGAEEEEKALRSRLRSLVITFLANDARNTVMGLARSRTSRLDDILIRGLTAAIPRAAREEVSLIVNNILLACCQSLKTRTGRGDELLNTILPLATNSLKEELRNTNPPKRTSLPNTSFYLRIARDITIRAGAADPAILLRFYLSSIASKITLQRLTDEAQISMIFELSEAWNACEDLAKRDRLYSTDSFGTIRNLLVQTCPVLFEPLIKSKLVDEASSRACMRLLNACHSRKTDAAWSAPTNLLALLAEVQKTASESMKQVGDQRGTAGAQRNVLQTIQNLCRPLLESSRPQVNSTTTSSTSTTSLTTTTSTFPAAAAAGASGPTRRITRPGLQRPPSTAMATATAGAQPSGSSASASSSTATGAGRPPLLSRFTSGASVTNGEGKVGSSSGGIQLDEHEGVGRWSLDRDASTGPTNIPNKRKLGEGSSSSSSAGPIIMNNGNGANSMFPPRIGRQPQLGLGQEGTTATSNPADDDNVGGNSAKRARKGGESNELRISGAAIPSLLSRIQISPSGAGGSPSPASASSQLGQRLSPAVRQNTGNSMSMPFRGNQPGQQRPGFIMANGQGGAGNALAGNNADNDDEGGFRIKGAASQGHGQTESLALRVTPSTGSGFPALAQATIPTPTSTSLLDRLGEADRSNGNGGGNGGGGGGWTKRRRQKNF